MKLKIYGERNTGTQFLREILQLNCSHALWPGTVAELGAWDRVADWDSPAWPERDRLLLREAFIDDIFAESDKATLGWKHGVPDVPLLRREGADTLFVITVKNPYAWVASMYRRPHHNLLTSNTASIVEFVKSPWLTCRRDNTPRHLASVVELWNLKYRAWCAIERWAPSVVVRYEDILEDPAALSELAQAVAPEQVRPWHLPATVRNNTGDLGSYKAFYRDERWRDELSPSCLDAIHTRLDPDLAARLGYGTT